MLQDPENSTLGSTQNSQSGRKIYSVVRSKAHGAAATFTLTQLKCPLLQEALPVPAPLLAGKASHSSALRLSAAFAMAAGVLG